MSESKTHIFAWGLLFCNDCKKRDDFARLCNWDSPITDSPMLILIQLHCHLSSTAQWEITVVLLWSVGAYTHLYCLIRYCINSTRCQKHSIRFWIIWCSVGHKGLPLFVQRKLHYTLNNSLFNWHKAGWIQMLMWFTSIQTQ